MRRWMRLVSVSPLLATLGWASAAALEMGASGEFAFRLSQRLDAAPATAARQPIDWVETRRRILEAQARMPADPMLHELLGVVAGRGGGGQEYLAQAAVHFAKAIELRPTSPYSWANLAATNYRMGDTGRQFETAIVRAAELGPWEPEVQRTVANYGLAVWDEVAPRTRAAIEGMVAAGMKRKPLELLQIANNRGRLAVACRHLPGSPRLTDPKWSQLCQSMEAS